MEGEKDSKKDQIYCKESTDDGSGQALEVIESKPVISGRALQRQKKLRFQPEDVKFQDKGPHHQYYKEVGGAEMKDFEVPRAVCVADKIESSVKEMKSMLRAVSQHTGDRTLLQKLPRHMRRRAASHNRKRLPRRLHQLATEMEKSQDSDKPEQKVNRRKRRRKHNLQTEYAKRAGKQGWLETHVWHAKRFHMTETTNEKFSKWGNRIALYPNDKSFRACYRAVAKHCLIQDISYLSCIKLCGQQDTLVSVIKGISDHMFTPEQLNGWMEVDILICRILCGDVVRCIGPASIIWNATIDDSTREVFLWLHPTILSEVCLLLKELMTELNDPLEICDVSGDLLRLRLTGPKASVTLLSILRPLNVTPGKSKDTEIGKWMEKERATVLQLHNDFVSQATDCHRDIFAREKKNFDHCLNGSVYPVVTDDPRLVLPIDKTTPTLTKIRDQIDETLECDTEFELPNYHAENSERQQPNLMCISPLWCQTIMEQVSCSREPDHIVSTRRRQMKVIEDSETHKHTWKDRLSTPVPVIAIRKVPNIEKMKEHAASDYQKGDHSGPGCTFASGWDLIIPKKWGTAFWIPLIYNRARPGGLRESQSINLEALKPHFPEDFPDTASGREWWKAEAKAFCSKHYRRPPAKRTNYSVTAVQSPFEPDWKAVFTISSSDSNQGNRKSDDDDCCAGEPLIKRQKLHESSVKVETSKISSNIGEKNDCLDGIGSAGDKSLNDEIAQISVLRMEKALSQLRSWMKHFMGENTSVDKSCQHEFPEFQRKNMLVCVGVQALGKGVPDARATLSFPTAQDLTNLCSELTDPYKYGLVSVSGPVEEKHWDPYRKERKEARKLKKQLKKEKTDGDTTPKVTFGDNVLATYNVVEKQTHFPVTPSRETIGYVTSGRFLYSHACGAGVGFITLKSLKRLCQFQVSHHRLGETLRSSSDDFKDLPLLALVRNVDSTQYRFVKLKLVRPW